MPSVPPGVMADFAVPNAPGQLTPHRGRDAFGAVVRTLVIAALVAAAVFGGRVAWEWNEERHDKQVAVILPPENVPAPPVQTVTFVRDLDASGQMAATVNLSSGDYLVEVGDIAVARNDQVLYQRPIGETAWIPTTERELAARSSALARAENAFLVMISDALPVESHPFLTIVDDESVELPGPVIPGAEAIEIDEIEAGPELDEIAGSGNADAILDDRIDPIANPALDGEAGSTAAGAQVLTRHLTVTVDRAAFTAAEPRAAHVYGFAGTTPVEVEIWVDRAGVVRKMSAADDVGRLGRSYQLIGASVADRAIFGAADPAPTEPPSNADEVSE